LKQTPKRKSKTGTNVHPSPEVKLGVRAVSTVSNFLFNGNLGNQGNSREFLSQLTVSIFDKIRIETFINVSIRLILPKSRKLLSVGEGV
jgi:hypothetical protein